MIKTYAPFLALAAGLAFTAASAHAQWRTPWSYSGTRGPAHWASLDPEYAACGGKQQSPIDIRVATKANLPPLKFDFRNGPLEIVNNGYTAVRVDYARGNGNSLLVGDTRYELTQFHFHHPSEEEIHGRAYAMVIHFMFRSNDGKVAGVAVLVHAGRSNPTVARLWKYMPRSAGNPHTIPGVEINPASLLPRDMAYYKYMGSITAPPCTEGVTWFVLKTPVSVSPAQIAAFAKFYRHDVRPVQPLDGRVVQSNE